MTYLSRMKGCVNRHGIGGERDTGLDVTDEDVVHHPHVVECQHGPHRCCFSGGATAGYHCLPLKLLTGVLLKPLLGKRGAAETH